MVLQSRKWRLLIRVMTLVVTSMLMLAFAAPASYALQDDRPKQITRTDQLFDKVRPIAETYVYASAIPDLKHIVTTHGVGTTYYWIFLPRYDNKLLVRTDSYSYLQAYFQTIDLNLDTSPREANFSGKLTTFAEQADGEKVWAELTRQGINIDRKQAMVLLQGEEPSTYRPMVPVVGVLAAFWALALVGLLRIWRGGRRGVKRKT